MNLTMRALIAVVATAAIVGLAGAYIGADALPGAEPTPGDDTPSPAATTPAATPSPAATTPVASGTPAPVPSDWKEYTDSALGFSLRFPPDLTATDLTSPGKTSGLSERVIDIRSETDRSRAVSISVSSIDADLTPKEWALKYTACIPDTISEGNVLANQAIFCTEQATEVTNAGVVIDYDGKIYHIGSLLTGEEFGVVLDSFRP